MHAGFEWSAYLMAFVYLAAGVNHFVMPKFYLPLMPRWIPRHELMIALSGFAELGLGLLVWLDPPARAWGSWGIILLLIAFMPVHVYMIQERAGKFERIPTWFLWARLPLQLALALWAYAYT